jgi:hypothetical protein
MLVESLSVRDAVVRAGAEAASPLILLSILYRPAEHLIIMLSNVKFG